MISPQMAPRNESRGAVGTGWLATVLLIGIGIVFWWMRDDSATGADAPDAARTVVVENRDVINAVSASGRIEPLARVAVMSRASGIIEALHADEGDVVKQGQVLVELDREQLRSQLEQDEADLLAAEARVNAARARLEEAQVRLSDPEPEYLRREAERIRELFKGGTVSISERDERERALASAEYRQRLVSASIPILEAAVAEAEAQLDAARADRDRSNDSLQEARITSPIDGVVLVREKEVGDGVSSILTAGGNATQIMVLGDLSTMFVKARVDEVDLGRIHVEMPALVTVDAHRGRTLEGRIERIAPAGSIDDNGIVTFEVEVSVVDEAGLLKPDMTADAKLVIERQDSMPSLPQIALRKGEGGTWLASKIVGEGEAARVESVEVELGLSDGLMTVIRSGLAPGDRVLLPAGPSRR